MRSERYALRTLCTQNTMYSEHYVLRTLCAQKTMRLSLVGAKSKFYTTIAVADAATQALLNLN